MSVELPQISRGKSLGSSNARSPLVTLKVYYLVILQSVAECYLILEY